ncbi:purine-nucleoside phosphorylase [Paraburkholderia silvatlantica]|uniref:Purine nucleoside permease n=1 Tax=Paraburkholderia silvatlantica TaxID=321895 RepID=A0ABR6FVU9_9BURK|nr:purine nucleoside permease [Paraburkholderia silvatlantica]MBB2931557.1 purine nucleoside permease [Paraburkholderia silvatlantica]PVY26651.1 purine nucleoside permease [Paraburkholderia silvatlantica]PXW32916.1 purine nucleoside permease [Paraburkholderia silvatlantica]
MRTRLTSLSAALALAACATQPPSAQQDIATLSAQPAAFAQAGAAAHERPVKVMIVTMFAPEARTWLDRLGPWESVTIAGLSPDYPDVHCNADDVCVMTTGMGHANAAASTMALAFAPQLDLRKTYFLIAGIAGVNPEQGTTGSAAWSDWLVDFGLQWEIDGDGRPHGWHTGYLGINTKGPSDKPALDYRTEVFRLNPGLTSAAWAISRGVTLADNAQAQAARAKYAYAPANRPPTVIRCDSVTDDTWWSGTALGARASEFTRQLTGGQGVYCMTQQEDNATFEALSRAARARRVDLDRVAVLRAGSDFDRPYAGESNAANLLNYASQGGFATALENLFRAGHPLVQTIVTHWSEWQDGIPANASAASPR